MSKTDKANGALNIRMRRSANDAFRRELTGGAVMVSPGIINLGGKNQRTILDAVCRRHDFGDDDPEDDHSVGDVEVTCTEAEPSVQLIFFRIDDVPGPAGTSRVLTVMLADEWWKAGPPIVMPDGYDDEPVITEVEDCTGDADGPDKSEAIRKLNDAFRLSMTGGTVVITAGIAALASNVQLQIIEAVKSFDVFTEDNDPWGEHDMGAFQIEGRRIFFKIDYYDLTRSMHAEDPTNPATTERVLTIMLAEEY